MVLMIRLVTTEIVLCRWYILTRMVKAERQDICVYSICISSKRLVTKICTFSHQSSASTEYSTTVATYNNHFKVTTDHGSKGQGASKVKVNYIPTRTTLFLFIHESTQQFMHSLYSVKSAQMSMITGVEPSWAHYLKYQS